MRACLGISFLSICISKFSQATYNAIPYICVYSVGSHAHMPIIYVLVEARSTATRTNKYCIVLLATESFQFEESWLS